jgi:uncharacterized membrane protein
MELHHLFAFVCGQYSDHTWAPGGIMLPVCQRCIGLYAGAAVAMALHLWLRPRLSARFLEMHGAFLLLMVPFGFHWLPQGPVLRAITGVLFAFGVVTYLWLPQRQMANRKWQKNNSRSSGVLYTAILVAMLFLIPALAIWGGKPGAWCLCSLTCIGALSLAALAVADICLSIAGCIRAARFVIRHSSFVIPSPSSFAVEERRHQTFRLD